MKVAYFVGAFKKEDGVTTVLVNLIREAQLKGIESIIITSQAEDASIVSVPIIETPCIPFPFGREYSVALPGVRGFEKQLDEFGPDVIHIHSPDTVAWAALSYARKNDIPIMATYHTNFVRYLSYYHLSFATDLVWSLLKKIYRPMNVITSPSHASARELADHEIPGALPIWWGINTECFNPAFRSESWRKEVLGEKKYIVLCVCRLYWLKDLHTLAETYNMLNSERDDFVMVIAGDGPARTELESLMPGALFLGHIEGDTLSRTYASADVFLFPSSTEVLDNVTFEAMASGVVPVVANIGEAPIRVGHEVRGLLGNVKDAQSFRDQVVRLLDDENFRMRLSYAGSAFAKEHSWGRVFERFLSLYKNLISKKISAGE